MLGITVLCLTIKTSNSHNSILWPETLLDSVCRGFTALLQGIQGCGKTERDSIICKSVNSYVKIFQIRWSPEENFFTII